MSLYRGAGGAGDAVADSASEALLVRELAIEVQADADAAAASATAAAGSASGASTSATNASNSASAAATSATNAANSASTATTQASNAATSATAAQTAETAAELAETNAETAETNAASSASAASSSASAASTSATNASNSASAAATSATNSANSATASATSATNSANSATAAAGSATTASTQATNAASSATAAASSATAAAGSATSASGSASTATTQAGIATTQATNASTSATNAATSATTATTQAGIATTQATNASNSASAAATSATNASNSASAASTSATNAANSATAAAASAASINLSSIAITGGSINGTTIGATTASTGAFTTLGATGVATFSAGTVSAPAITTTGDTNTGIFFPAADTIAFTEGGVESMRITSTGNVGIGASSTSAFFNGSNTAAKVFISYSSTNTSVDDPTPNLALHNPSTTTNNYSSLYFSTVNTGSTLVGTSAILGIHGARDGAWGSGALAFLTTAGSSDGPTERMRIDSSGNVGIGTSSPASFTGGSNGLAVSVNGNSALAILRNAATTGVTFDQLQVGVAQAASSAYHFIRCYSSVNTSPVVAHYVNGNGDGYFAGNVGIGTSSPTSKVGVISDGVPATSGNMSTGLYVGASNSYGINIGGSSSGAYAWINAAFLNNSGTAAPLVLATGSTERMRIDASGNLLVGTTSSSGTITTKASTANGSTNAFQAQNSASTQLCAIRSDGLFNLGLAANSPYNYTTGSGANAFLNASGELQRSTSSLKYKTDVKNATFGIADVMKLRPVTYKGKSETDGDTIYAGLIAEEVDSAGLKEFVQYAEDGTPDALSYGNMVALAFKAIQELKAELDSVKAELQTIKGV